MNISVDFSKIKGNIKPIHGVGNGPVTGRFCSNKVQEFKDAHTPVIRRKRRPKREVMGGFKMSYRYRYYMDDVIEDEDLEEELEE